MTWDMVLPLFCLIVLILLIGTPIVLFTILMLNKDKCINFVVPVARRVSQEQATRLLAHNGITLPQPADYGGAPAATSGHPAPQQTHVSEAAPVPASAAGAGTDMEISQHDSVPAPTPLVGT